MSTLRSAGGDLQRWFLCWVFQWKNLKIVRLLPIWYTSQALPWGSALGSVRYTPFTDNTKNHIHFMLDQTGCLRTSGFCNCRGTQFYPFFKPGSWTGSVRSKLSIVRDHCFATLCWVIIFFLSKKIIITSMLAYRKWYVARTNQIV